MISLFINKPEAKMQEDTDDPQGPLRLRIPL